MKLILIILASLFTFLFAILAYLPSIKFTRTQRSKYPFLKKIDGKQIYFAVAALICAFLVAFTGGLKDYIAMRPADEANQIKENETNSQSNFQQSNQQSNLSNSNLNGATEVETNQPKIKQEIVTASKQIISKKNEKTSQKAIKVETTKTPILKPQSLDKARSLISQGKYNAAIIECDKILSVNPRNSDALSLKKWSQKQLEILNP